MFASVGGRRCNQMTPGVPDVVYPIMICASTPIPSGSHITGVYAATPHPVNNFAGPKLTHDKIRQALMETIVERYTACAPALRPTWPRPGPLNVNSRPRKGLCKI